MRSFEHANTVLKVPSKKDSGVKSSIGKERLISVSGPCQLKALRENLHGVLMMNLFADFRRKFFATSMCTARKPIQSRESAGSPHRNGNDEAAPCRSN